MGDRSREIQFRFLAEPTDVNFGGKVHGGIIMKWIDQAAYACAAGWSGKYCVTISVGNIRFYRPVLVGNLVEVSAKIVHTGNTSMNIYVSVKSRDPKSAAFAETNHCFISFIATDEAGYPVSVPSWEPKNKEDKLLQKYAIKMKSFTEDNEATLREDLAGIKKQQSQKETKK
ncbi:acyl-CoA thioesterase [Flocculibacter collagenilyticus]|uniref:acyl-CoA thioesterase n=1 Tax=Flocculibacter collagenilyticus TaxID=2744479 RepID=UPI0018F4D440|nr:acyl-CoA thioesterase [Flocculibacter collagenilyticus]